MEDLSVKTKSLNPAALAATAPGSDGTDKSGSAPADAFAIAFNQFLRRAAKPEQMLGGARGQVLPFNISFGAHRAEPATSDPRFDRPEAPAPRPESSPAATAARDDRPASIQDSRSAASESASKPADQAPVESSTAATDKSANAQVPADQRAQASDNRDPSRAADKSQVANAVESDEHGRGRKKKSTQGAAKDNGATPKEQAIAVLTALAAANAPKGGDRSRSDESKTTDEKSEDGDDDRRLTGIANALNQLAKQSRGPARAGANQAGEGERAAAGEKDADADKGDVKEKKAGALMDTRARQAADLAERVGPGTRMTVEVDVADEAKILISRPTGALFAARGDQGGDPALTHQGSAGTEAMPEQQIANTLTSDASDDIAARLALMPGANGVNAASTMTIEGEKPGVQIATQGLAAANGGPARALDAPSQTNAAQHAQRPAANFRAEVLEQVSVNIQKAIKDGADRITIQLRPAELGRIDVRIEIAGDGRTLVHVAADRSDTLDLLQRDARDLARSLQDAGLRADAGNLQFSLREQTAENRERNPHGTTPGGSAAVDLDAAHAEQPPVWTPTVLPGRVDIRA
jgi:hypothetical protein